jgi:type IV secretion system protein VirB6
MSHNGIIKAYAIKCTLLISMVLSTLSARADYEWMDSLASFLSTCIEVPSFSYNSSQASKTLEFKDSYTTGWQSTGANVKNGRAITFEWSGNSKLSSSKSVSKPVRKYYVMYRIDPRFARPQTFILTGAEANKVTTYTSDINMINNGVPNTDVKASFAAYNNYFNFTSSTPRTTIPITSTSVVNINLVKANEFFAKGATGLEQELNFGLDTTKNPFAIYTQVGITDNNIVYMSSEDWCAKLFGINTPSGYTCSNVGSSTLYANDNQFADRLVGIADTILGGGKLNICDSRSTDKAPCLYDRGRGMQITIGGNIVKKTEQPFTHSEFTQEDFFYYDANANGGLSGVLDFTTDWDMQNTNPMFQSFDPLMQNWTYKAQSDWQAAFMGSDSAKIGGLSQYLHFGRYIMHIEVGENNDNDEVSVEYIISNSQPSDNTYGTRVTSSFSGEANGDGTLYLRALSPNNTTLKGTIVVNYYSYTGSTFLSDLISNDIVAPLIGMLMKSTKTLYDNLSQSLINPGRLLLTLYIVFYGLYFLIGAVNIKAFDLVIRVVKISIVATMFSTNSWDFFNDNFFQGFVDGSKYLINSVVGSTNNGSIFGFVDLIFDKYLNPKMWGLLTIELLSPFNGVTFFAIITIYSIIIYLAAVLQIVIGYIMAFISMAVLISLAPIFITLMLFERTRSIFNNWVSAIFNCMLQPTILMLFFLLIDQIIADQLPHVVLHACWDWIIKFQLTFDLSSLGIPLTFPSVTIPGFEGIAFFMATPTNGVGFSTPPGSYLNFVSSVIIFCCYAVMASGLTSYVTGLVSALTGVGQTGEISGGAASSQIASSINDKISTPAQKILEKVQAKQATAQANKEDKAQETRDRGAVARK